MEYWFTLKGFYKFVVRFQGNQVRFIYKVTFWRPIIAFSKNIKKKLYDHRLELNSPTCCWLNGLWLWSQLSLNQTNYQLVMVFIPWNLKGYAQLLFFFFNLLWSKYLRFFFYLLLITRFFKFHIKLA